MVLAFAHIQNNASALTDVQSKIFLNVEVKRTYQNTSYSMWSIEMRTQHMVGKCSIMDGRMSAKDKTGITDRTV